MFLGSTGASGGLLLMWDSRVVEKLEGAVEYFSVSCKFKNVEDQHVWMFTGVYGPNIERDRRLMRDELAGIRSWWDVPWCLGGDFNMVKVSSLSRIDRFLYSADWAGDYINIIQKRLDCLNSDHFPVALECGNIQRRRRPFCFENMWLLAEGFVERVRSWWGSYQVEGTPSFVFTSKLKALKVDLKKWNETEFGHVNAQKQNLLAGLRELDVVADLRPLSDEEKGKRELLTTNLEKFAAISDEDAFWLERPFEENEIESVVQGCNGDKALGSDGFSLAFFQHCWSIVRNDILAVCQEFHEHYQFERSLNATFVSLIPKKHGEDELKDFRPISLVGGMYKIIAKLLANRLNCCLGKDHLSVSECVCESPCGFFPSSRGIRQGDPLSSMLFVIVMEAFSRLIDKATDVGMLSGFSVGRLNSAPLEVSHLCLQTILSFFVRRLRIIFFICDLSLFGSKLHQVCESIWVNQNWFKLVRNLLWGTSEEVAKIHLVKWDMVCSPYSHGGLAIKNIRRFNEALLGKWLWQFGVEREAFWRKVIMVKYGSLEGGWISKAPNEPHGVGLWKFIHSRWAKFSKFTAFEVGDGSLIRFWDDVWCIDEPLKLAYPELYRIACVKDALVVDFVQIRGQAMHWEVTFTRLAQDWELESISSFFDLLYSTNILSTEKDKMCWKPARTKGFQVKSFYTQLTSSAALGKILTTDNLRRRGIIVVSWCCMCKVDGESVDHLLLHCPYAKELWDMIFGLFGIQWVMPKRVIDLLSCWHGSVGRHSVIWKAIPHYIMWCLWRERNVRTFEDCELSVVELKLHFYCSLLDWTSVTGLFRLSNMLDLIDYCSF
uniref:Reverse transcriptase zinc-binding domain-containing protein n=1 Tax=Fagus sylvatica TaxID=28930 RepID=A0A2N9IEM8_FAGSY